MRLKHLVFALRQYLSDEAGAKPSVGHTYELLASLMGYDSFASLHGQAFLVSLRGSYWKVIENVRVLLAGYPEPEAAAKRHEALRAAGDAQTVARKLKAFAAEHELLAIPYQPLIISGSSTGADAWSVLAFEELLKGLITITHDQRELTLSMLEDACTREEGLGPPIQRLYHLLHEHFVVDTGLSATFRERAEFHKRRIAINSVPIETPFLSIDLWDPAYGSANSVVAYSADSDRARAAGAIITAILPQEPHTIWATHDGSLNHLAGLGFTRVSLNLLRQSQPDRVCLNPFVSHDGLVALEDRIAVAQILHLMMRSVDPQYCYENPDLLQVLQEALYDFYRDRDRNSVSREPTIRHFIDWLQGFNWKNVEGEDISFVLAPFFGGGRYAGLFNGPFALGAHSDWVLFDITALEGTPALAPAMLILATHLDAKCRYTIKRSEKKALILGHDWIPDAGTEFSVPFSQLYKSFRRYNLGVLAVCESVTKYISLQDDHPDSALADGLLANTSHSFALNSAEHGHVLEHSTFTYERPV